MIIPLPARLIGWQLPITLSSCPKGGVLTIWDGKRLLKKIAPSDTRIKVSLQDFVRPLPTRLHQPISPLRQQLTVCFAAPGHRFAQVRVRI